MLYQRLRLYPFILCVLTLGLALAFRISWQEEPQKIPRGEVKMVATLAHEPKITEARQVLSVGEAKVYVDLYPKYRQGDRLSIEGVVDENARIFNAKVEKIGRKRTLSANFGDLRSRLLSNIQGLLGAREATLIAGTVLGVDSIARDFNNQLIRTGTIHVVVVSGQNLMIVAGIFMGLFKYTGRRLGLILATTAVFAYAFLTGFEPPVVRASLMVLAATIALFVGREFWPIWSLGVVAFLIVFIWPAAAGEISFQLTFAATLGIMTLGQDLGKLWGKWRFFGQNAAIATSAYVFTLPVILYYFGSASILAPIANVLVAEAVFPIMVLGFLIAFASLIFMPVAQLLAYFAYVPAFYFVKVVEVFAQLPLEPISLGKGSLGMVLIYYLMLFSMMAIWGRTSKFKF